ncbi:very short patch repair endonuclease [Sphingobium sp. R-7]|uniref:very short patch repair endonuclease n=1 Tax=Sphingobium sp. R-7 TaxID=3375449 RepID=UPI00398AFA11
MADIVTPEVRSRMMSGIGPANTKPEMLIRRGLHSLGYRYRLHVKGLPGKPDLVFPGRHAVIFVHGCFWHGHDCGLFRWPSTREEFWRSKIAGNIARDRKVKEQLLDLGWRVLDVWECALRGKARRAIDDALAECAYWLESDSHQGEIRGSVQSSVTFDAG